MPVETKPSARVTVGKIRYMAQIRRYVGRTNGGSIRYQRMVVGIPAHLNQYRLPEINESFEQGEFHQGWRVSKVWSIHVL